MQDTFPKPVNGSDLATLRKAQGVKQQALADLIGVTRGRLYVWEHTPDLDPIRAARYERALRELVTAETAGTVVGVA